MENTEMPTPRTDAVYNEVHKYEHPTGTYMLVQLCRELERELKVATNQATIAMRRANNITDEALATEDQRDKLVDALRGMLDLWAKCGGNQEDRAALSAEEALAAVERGSREYNGPPIVGVSGVSVEWLKGKRMELLGQLVKASLLSKEARELVEKAQAYEMVITDIESSEQCEPCGTGRGEQCWGHCVGPSPQNDGYCPSCNGSGCDEYNEDGTPRDDIHQCDTCMGTGKILSQNA